MVAKHVALTSVLSAAVDARNLLELSELEQELACDDSLTDSFNRLDKAMSDAQAFVCVCVCVCACVRVCVCVYASYNIHTYTYVYTYMETVR